MPPALEMVVVQDGAAHDGQVGIAAQQVVGELRHKSEEPPEGAPVDAHGHVPAVQHDAVLGVVGVG